MMAIDAKRLSERADEVLNEAAVAKALKARATTRRTQALLAAAGEIEPHRRWYVLRLASRCEFPVDKALEEAGVERWLPVETVRAARHGGRGGRRPEPREVPIWPGYLFVRVANTAEAWAGLATVEGVVSVLGTADHPAPISDDIVLKLKLFLQQDRSARDILTNALRKGDRVRVDDGPFASFDGVVRWLGGFDRAKVEVDIFGRKCLVELRLAQISKSA